MHEFLKYFNISTYKILYISFIISCEFYFIVFKYATIANDDQKKDTNTLGRHLKEWKKTFSRVKDVNDLENELRETIQNHNESVIE